MANLEISFDWRPFVREIRTLRPPALNRPVALALADTAKQASSKAASAIAKHTGLRKGKVTPHIWYDKIAVGDYETFIRSSRKLIPLIEFGARETSAGVRAAKPWGQAQVFRGAFIATMPSGHMGVFRRVGRRRLPIEEMMGPSIHSTFAQPAVIAPTEATIRQRLPVNLARRIRAARRGR